MAPRGKNEVTKTKEAEKPSETFFWRQKLSMMRQGNVIDDTHVPDYVKSTPLTGKELEENKRLLERVKNSKMTKFILRSEEIAEKEAEEARKQNAKPLRPEDEAFWKKLPPIPSPFGGPALVKKAIKTKEEGAEKIIDFMKQFQFGLWGYKQRSYPPEKPFDIQQALGFKWLDNRYYDFAMRGGNFYYKDRLGRTRGPMQILHMKTAWAAGIIDKNTFVWGDDMDEFAPIGMVYGLERAVATPDMQLAAWGTKAIHAISSGISPWLPKKGHEIKSFKEMQKVALAKKERENSIMANNGGLWPGEQIPSHVLGLWAGGSGLTDLLENSSKRFPEKFIPYPTRVELAKKIPGLRPWEILEFEQAFDYLTFRNSYYRQPLGTFYKNPTYHIQQTDNEYEEIMKLKESNPELVKFEDEVNDEDDGDRN